MTDESKKVSPQIIQRENTKNSGENQENCNVQLNDLVDSLELNGRWLFGDTLLNKEFSQERFLVEDIIPVIGIGGRVGPPDCGKSLWSRDLAISITNGDADFLGYKINAKHKRVLVILTEDDETATQWSLRKQVREAKITYLNNIVFLWADSITPDELNLDIFHLLANIEFDLVIIDSFGDVFVGKDPNNVQQMRETLKPYTVMANKYKCFFLIIHHIGKSSYDKVPEQNHVLGSAGFAQKCRSILDLRNHPVNQNQTILTLTKGNYVSRELKEISYILDFSEDTLRFTNTGHKMDKFEFNELLGNKYGQKSTICNWDKIFGNDEELSTAELSNRLKELFHIGQRTAEERIKEANDKKIIERTKKGFYRRMNPQPQGYGDNCGTADGSSEDEIENDESTVIVDNEEIVSLAEMIFQ